MQQQIFLRLLVNKYFPERLEQLAKIVPEKTFQEIKSHNFSEKCPECILFFVDTWLTSCHPSWLEPLISEMTLPLKTVYLSCFPQPISDYFRAKEEYKDIPSAAPPAEPIRQFLLGFLHRKWEENHPLPKELLQENELSSLLVISRQELLEVVDLLAVYDLVDEVRHIVDKKQLQLILNHLSIQQQHYLRLSLRQKTKSVGGAGVVRELMKEPARFSMQLHRRGLQRLAYGLCGMDRDFLWHIMHTFDMPRAKFMMQYVQPEVVPTTTSLVRQDVQQILQFLKRAPS